MRAAWRLSIRWSLSATRMRPFKRSPKKKEQQKKTEKSTPSFFFSFFFNGVARCGRWNRDWNRSSLETVVVGCCCCCCCCCWFLSLEDELSRRGPWTRVMRRSFVCFCFCCFDSPLFCVFVRADPIGSGDGGQSRPVSTLDLFFYRFPFFIISFRFRFMLRFVFVCFGFLFFRFFFVSQKRMRRTRNAKAETKENVGFLFQRKKKSSSLTPRWSTAIHLRTHHPTTNKQ